MAKVLNRKTARVGLPTHSNSIAYFEPGEHEYPDAIVDDLNNSRASVRAYFEGDPPVLEVLSGQSKPASPAKPKAADLVALCKVSTDLDWLKELGENDERKTVKDAVEARLEDLEAIS